MIGKDIGEYIINNRIALIVQIILSVIFLIIPFLITGKRKSSAQSLIQNNTSILKVKVLVQQLLINVRQQSSTTVVYSSTHSSKGTNGENDSIIIWIVGALAGTFLYQKYHVYIMNWLTIYTIIVLVSTMILVTLLYRKDMLDRLNQLWIGTMLYLVIINFINIALMSQQQLLVNGDISLWIRVLYYVEGFIFIAFVNLIIILVQLHLIFLNLFLTKPNKFSAFIIRKTSFLLNKPVWFVTFIIILSSISLLFSSDYAFELVGKTIS
ncbi:hypothetical protein [Paenibacillus polymyxa]|uniref:hypothetical protein n=1 Tax=Paenibacillus polymyxa TaxID=1406 RepID=UPI0021E38576|nr:hypothetical protein [Paenibacillus polymyxa]